MSTVLGRVAWDDVDARVRHEQRNREVYVPPISLYRWWARRPNALIGALIDAAAVEYPNPVVSDPFSGGGTVAMEATRRGLTLYAQDLHPWALSGLTTVLDNVDPDALERAAKAVLSTVTERCAGLYSVPCELHGDKSEFSHVFWVRTRRCPACDALNHLFPYSLLTLASRHHGESDGFYGCATCGSVSRHKVNAPDLTCPSCARPIPSANTPLLAGRRFECIGKGCRQSFPAFDGESPTWTPVLALRVCETESGSTAHFDEPHEPALAVSTSTDDLSALNELIPEGIETSLLRRAGFERWADAYPPRQLHTMASAAAAIAELGESTAVKARLRLALCGAAEMAGYLSRWDRYYPKAFEATANHRFPALGFSCETNLLASRGRGTLLRRFAQSVKAAEWSREHMAPSGEVRVARPDARRRSIGSGALLVCGSSERQLPSDGSIDLVLTDPPYFDDVQYAELAALFLVWARAVDLVPASVTLDLSAEAVANHVRGSGVDEYQILLSRIFKEARRTLKPSGRLILTFHNTDIRAWWALSTALHEAELHVHAVAVAEAENSSDHPKRTTNAFTSDLVIECVHANAGTHEPVIVNAMDGAEAQELYAAGQAIAAGGAMDLPTFTASFLRSRGSVSDPLIRAPKAGSA